MNLCYNILYFSCKKELHLLELNKKRKYYFLSFFTNNFLDNFQFYFTMFRRRSISIKFLRLQISTEQNGK